MTPFVINLLSKLHLNRFCFSCKILKSDPFFSNYVLKTHTRSQNQTNKVEIQIIHNVFF